MAEEIKVEEALEVVKKAQEAKQKEFADKIAALCEEYGFALDVVSQIVIKPVK